MPTDSRRITEFYDKISESYDPLYGDEQSEKHGSVCEILHGQRFSVLVDAGCGTGNLLAKTKDNYAYGLGIDLSVKMLRRARAKIETGTCDFVRADCSAMPVRPRTADCTLSISVVDSFARPQRVIRELRRITGKNGLLVLSVIHPKGGAPNLEGVRLGRRAWSSSKESLHVARL